MWQFKSAGKIWIYVGCFSVRGDALHSLFFSPPHATVNGSFILLSGESSPPTHTHTYLRPPFTSLFLEAFVPSDNGAIRGEGCIEWWRGGKRKKRKVVLIPRSLWGGGSDKLGPFSPLCFVEGSEAQRRGLCMCMCVWERPWTQPPAQLFQVTYHIRENGLKSQLSPKHWF